MAEKKAKTKGGRGRPPISTFTEEQIAEALRKAAGLRSHAAKMLGVSPATMTRLIRRYPDLENVIAETRQRIVDLAEAKLIEAVQNGHMTAIIFTLKTLGGWSERHVLTGPDGGAIEVRAEGVDREALIRTIDERIARHGGGEAE